MYTQNTPPPDVLQLKEVEKPAPSDDEVLVEVHAASVNYPDWANLRGKPFGAEVTGVCSTRNLDLVRSIGADQAIDYTREDFTQTGERYDLILAAGGYRSIFDYRRALSPRGVYVLAGGAMAQVYQAMFLGPFISMAGSKRMVSLAAKPSQADLVFVKEIIEAGQVWYPSSIDVTR